MKTVKKFISLVMLLALLTSTGAYAQRLESVVKKEIKKETNKAVNKKSSEKSVAVSSTNNAGMAKDFIQPSEAIFHDNFNTELAMEFPRKWTQINGTVQNNRIKAFGKDEGVIQIASTYATIKPSIKGDRYLGESFKVEAMVYFHGKGNEAYYFNLKNADDPYKNHDIRIARGAIKDGGDQLARVPGGIEPGWHLIQISFNKGNTKMFFDGHQLINNPDMGKNTFTHLEIEVISPNATKAPPMYSTINHFTIGKGGLPLYDRLITSGRLVVQDIHFENNSYDIMESSFGVLDNIVNMLTEHPEISLTVQGHTDSNGTPEDNQILSENRANAIRNYLISKNIKRSRLGSEGYGEEQPIDSSDNETAWAKNRRVVFKLRQ